MDDKYEKEVRKNADMINEIILKWPSAVAPFKNVKWIPKGGEGKQLLVSGR